MPDSKSFSAKITTTLIKDSLTTHRPALSASSLTRDWLRLLSENCGEKNSSTASLRIKKRFQKYKRQRTKPLALSISEILHYVQKYADNWGVTVTDNSIVKGLQQASLLAPEDEDKLTPKKYRFPYPITIEGDTLTLCKYEEMEEYLNG